MGCMILLSSMEQLNLEGGNYCSYNGFLCTLFLISTDLTL